MVGVDRVKFSHLGLSHLFRVQRGKCFYCGKFMAKNKATRDHLHPKSKGNVATLNIVACCRICNELKANNTPSDRAVDKARFIYAQLGVPAVAI